MLYEFFLKGKMYSGIELISQLSNLEEQMKTMDLLITGEGKMDNQSLHGKVPVVAFVGGFSGSEEQFEKEGISVIVPIVDQITTLEDAIKNVQSNLRRTTKRSLKLMRLFERK